MDEGFEISQGKLTPNVQEIADSILKDILVNQNHARFSFYRQFLHISPDTVFVRIKTVVHLRSTFN